MLKNIDPVLSPDLLRVLRAMGHGDEIALVDANYPAASNAKRLIRLDGVTAPRALDAILSVMPLDDFSEYAAFRMEVVGDAKAELPIHAEFRATLQKHDTSKPAILSALDRHAFYARAKNAFAIIATTETRLYGNIILVKGVIRPA